MMGTKRISLSWVCAGALLMSGCAAKVTSPPASTASAIVSVEPGPEIPVEWRTVATKPDAERLDRLREAWEEGLADARKAGSTKAIRAEGKLLQPYAAQARPLPPPGRYRCRTIKLGRAGQGKVDSTMRAYPPFFCYVEQDGDLTIFIKETGSQRPAGRLWPDGDRRLVFLGAGAFGAEGTAAPPYGESAEQDVVGVVERVAPFRWRLVLPWPRVESKIDVIELVPFLGEESGGDKDAG